MSKKERPYDYDERRAANRAWWFIFWLGIIAFALSLASCKTTQSSACGITAEDSERLTAHLEQVQTVERHEDDVAYNSSMLETATLTLRADSATEMEQVSEIVTEHSVITTDSLGITTETIDRTTQRTSMRNRTQTSTDEDKALLRQQEESLALHLSYLDSVYNNLLDSLSMRNSEYLYRDKAKVKKNLLDMDSVVGIVLFWCMLVIAGGVSYYVAKQHYGKEK